MYTKEDIEKLNNKKKTLITNYINKFIASRWREENESYSLDECLDFKIVQYYIDMVVNLPDAIENNDNKIEIDTINVGCGGTNNG